MVHYTLDGSGGFTSDKYFYHYDGRGNVTQLTNDSQNVVANYTYDAFGNTVASGAGVGLNTYRFSTKEQIGGLYYYGYRFYSPGLGKWINRDPIQESGGINLYQYVNNAPIINVDNYGHVTLAIIAIGAAAGALTDIAGQIMGNLLSGKKWWCINLTEVGIAALGGAMSALAIEGVPPWLISALANVAQTIGTDLLTQHRMPTAQELQSAAITGAVGGGFGQGLGAIADGVAEDIGDTAVENTMRVMGAGESGFFSNTMNSMIDKTGLLCPSSG